MTRLAFLCPGQGAQHVGMGVDLCREFSVARESFAEADEALGYSLSDLCASGPEERLTLTENAQPALLALSVAIGRVLAKEGGFAPTIGAGHSLGEWSALVLLGSLDFRQALAAVRQRGRFMQEAVPPGKGAMSALLGAESGVVAELCREATRGEDDLVVPANLNGAGQVVVAGHASAVARLETLALGKRIRATRLKVSAPFHCPLMAPAAEKLRPVVAALQIRAPRAPLVTNVEATETSDPMRIAELLVAQVTSPVRWEECARIVLERADVAIEIGPGRALGGLLRRMDRGFPCRPTGDVAGIRDVLAEVRP